MSLPIIYGKELIMEKMKPKDTNTKKPIFVTKSHPDNPSSTTRPIDHGDGMYDYCYNKIERSYREALGLAIICDRMDTESLLKSLRELWCKIFKELEDIHNYHSLPLFHTNYFDIKDVPSREAICTKIKLAMGEDRYQQMIDWWHLVDDMLDELEETGKISFDPDPENP